MDAFCLSSNSICSFKTFHFQLCISHFNDCRNTYLICYSRPFIVLDESEVPEREWEEIEIAVPWGHVAGKWYGDRNTQPVLTFHGWQDNAGTYDRLIPLLPKTLSYLCIDLPGHGRY